MFFKISFPDNKLERSDNKKYLHYFKDHDCHEAKVNKFKDCQTVSETSELIDIFSDEKIIIFDGSTLTVQVGEPINVKITKQTKFTSFKVDFRLTSWNSENEGVVKSYADSFPEYHCGHNMIEFYDSSDDSTDDSSDDSTDNSSDDSTDNSSDDSTDNSSDDSTGNSSDDSTDNSSDDSTDDSDQIQIQSNHIQSEWIRKSEFSSRIVINAITDLLPKKFGSPLYLIVTLSRNIQLYSLAFELKALLSLNVTKAPSTSVSQELVMRQVDDSSVPEYVWNFKPGFSRFVCILESPGVMKLNNSFSLICLKETICLKIYTRNFSRAYSNKSLMIQVELVLPMGLDILERLNKPILEADFSGTHSLKHICSYEYGLFHFSLGWRHFTDPSDHFKVGLKLNYGLDEILKNFDIKENRYLKLLVTIRYENRVIDKNEATVFLSPEKINSEEKKVIMRNFENKETLFRSLMPVMMFFFINLSCGTLASIGKYIPCFIVDSNRDSLFSQILTIINNYEKNHEALKFFNIVHFTLDDEVILNKSLSDFVAPEFTLVNKTVFDLKYKTTRVRDSSLPECFRTDEFVDKIRNTDLCTRVVIQIMLSTSLNNESIQKSLKKDEIFSRTFK